MSFKRDHPINNEQEEIMTDNVEKSNPLNSEPLLPGQIHIEESIDNIGMSIEPIEGMRLKEIEGMRLPETV